MIQIKNDKMNLRSYHIQRLTQDLPLLTKGKAQSLAAQSLFYSWLKLDSNVPVSLFCRCDLFILSPSTVYSVFMVRCLAKKIMKPVGLLIGLDKEKYSTIFIPLQSKTSKNPGKTSKVRFSMPRNFVDKQKSREKALGSHFDVLLEGKLDHKQKRRENAKA